METITVYVGSIVTSNSGQTNDNRKEVQFTGEELASRTEYGYSDRSGGLTDTRGVTETLYRAEGGRLIVHVKDWSRWQGEPNIETLHDVTEADLQPNGRFDALGANAGFGRPLTLDEATQKSERPD